MVLISLLDGDLGWALQDSSSFNKAHYVGMS